VFCTGFCPSVLEPAALTKFPASKDLEIYIQPGSGHGINFSVGLISPSPEYGRDSQSEANEILQPNATGAFEVIPGSWLRMVSEELLHRSQA
jgi:hypothetical protein